MTDPSREDIELAFIRVFSVGGSQLGKTVSRTERRERVRQAIYLSGLTNERLINYRSLGENALTYAEAFRVCYGERLDRRAAMRALPEPPDDEPHKEWPEQDSVPQAAEKWVGERMPPSDSGEALHNGLPHLDTCSLKYGGKKCTCGLV